MDTNLASPFIALVVAGGGLIVFWMKIASRLSVGEAARQVAEDAERKADAFAQQLADHRIKTAGDVAALRTVAEETAKTLANAEMRLSKSIDDLVGRFDHFSDQLNSILTSLVKKPPIRRK